MPCMAKGVKVVYLANKSKHVCYMSTITSKVKINVDDESIELMDPKIADVQQ